MPCGISCTNVYVCVSFNQVSVANYMHFVLEFNVWAFVFVVDRVAECALIILPVYTHNFYHPQPNHRGHFLLEYVCEQLDIHDRDYFGLRFEDSSKQRHWLDSSKYIIKQVKDIDPVLFSFRVKFYPADPFRIGGNGKFFLYQQLKRDLRHGRLYCSAGEAAALGALVVQGKKEGERLCVFWVFRRITWLNIRSAEEIGDYDAELHHGDYVAGVKLVLRQTEQLNHKVIELHQKREQGQEPHLAVDEFMAIARELETYGVDPHPVKVWVTHHRIAAN